MTNTPPALPAWPPDYVRRMDEHVIANTDEQLFWDWAEIRGQLCDAWKRALPPTEPNEPNERGAP